MSTSVEVLSHKLLQLSNDATAIQARIDAEGRTPTQIESAEMNRLMAEFESVSTRIKSETMAAEMNRPLPRKTGPGSLTNTSSPNGAEFKAFGDFVKSGSRITNAAAMTISGGNDDGAATVPTLVSDQVREVAKSRGAIRTLATVMGVRQPVELPIATTLPGAEWVVEAGTRSALTVPVVKTATLPGGSMSSVIPVSTELLNDSAWDLNRYVIDAIGRAFGVTEAAAFISGTGADGQVKGILAYTLAATADASRTWGQLEKLHTGTSGGGVTPDKLLELSVKLDPAYRARASFVMHPATYSTLLQTKASTSGNYLLDGSSSASGLPSAWGLPVHLDVNVPVLAADAAVVLCGDFRAGYTIQDIGAMSVVRDPYKTYGMIQVWCEQRIRAGVVDSNAIKVLVASA